MILDVSSLKWMLKAEMEVHRVEKANMENGFIITL